MFYSTRLIYDQKETVMNKCCHFQQDKLKDQTTTQMENEGELMRERYGERKDWRRGKIRGGGKREVGELAVTAR